MAPKRQTLCSTVKLWWRTTDVITEARAIVFLLILMVKVQPSLLHKPPYYQEFTHSEDESKINRKSVQTSAIPSKIHYTPHLLIAKRNNEDYEWTPNPANFSPSTISQHNHNEKSEGRRTTALLGGSVKTKTLRIKEEEEDKDHGSVEFPLGETKPTKLSTTFDLVSKTLLSSVVSSSASSLSSSSSSPLSTLHSGGEQRRGGRNTRSLKNDTFTGTTKKVISPGGGILKTARSHHRLDGNQDGKSDDVGLGGAGGVGDEDDDFYGLALEKKEKNVINEKIATREGVEEKEAIEGFQEAFLNREDVLASKEKAFSKMDMRILEKFPSRERSPSSMPPSLSPPRKEEKSNIGEGVVSQLSSKGKVLRNVSNDIKMQELKDSSTPDVMSTKTELTKDDIVAAAVAPKPMKVRVKDEVGDEQHGKSEENGKGEKDNDEEVHDHDDDGDGGGRTQEEFDESAEGAPEGIDSSENSSAFYYYYTSKTNKKNEEREERRRNHFFNQTSSSRLTFANSANPDKGNANRKNSPGSVHSGPMDLPRESMVSTTSADEVKLYRLVQRLLKESPLIDGHNDLPWNLRKFLHGQLLEFDFDSDLRSSPPWSKSAWSHTDLPRLRRGLVGAQFWVAYAPCESQNLNAVQITLEQIDLIRRLIARYPDNLTLALTADDIEKAHKAGKIASLIAVEGGHSIGASLSTLRTFYELGVRYMTLTHNCNTPWADSARPGHKPEHGGLTEFGRAVVREMNRLGMLVDLSHTSKLTMKDALKVSKAPVIFSHSSAYALCNSSRNVPDDILKELVWNRGIIMVTFYNIYVKCNMQATVRDVADHINYIRGKIGLEHLGVGSDYDGINLTPVGLEDVSKFPNLFVELARSPNWSNDEIKMVAGRNFLRVFREAENVRDAMRSSGVPASFEAIPPRDIMDSNRCRLNTTSSSTSSIH